MNELLQRYLTLLDEYTSLRTELSRLQTGVYQDLARANFAAERGMRYGADYYDERMQALRTLRVDVPTEAAHMLRRPGPHRPGARPERDRAARPAREHLLQRPRQRGAAIRVQRGHVRRGRACPSGVPSPGVPPQRWPC